MEGERPVLRESVERERSRAVTQDRVGCYALRGTRDFTVRYTEQHHVIWSNRGFPLATPERPSHDNTGSRERASDRAAEAPRTNDRDAGERDRRGVCHGDSKQ